MAVKSGANLVKALCEGILSTGCDVVDLGMVPTPLLYYAADLHDGTFRCDVNGQP